MMFHLLFFQFEIKVSFEVRLVVEVNHLRLFKMLHYRFFEEYHCIFEDNERHNINKQILNEIINENAHKFRFTSDNENDKINKIDFHDIQ